AGDRTGEKGGGTRGIGGVCQNTQWESECSSKRDVAAVDVVVDVGIDGDVRGCSGCQRRLQNRAGGGIAAGCARVERAGEDGLIGGQLARLVADIGGQANRERNARDDAGREAKIIEADAGEAALFTLGVFIGKEVKRLILFDWTAE